jgi:hypothetical protein
LRYSEPGKERERKREEKRRKNRLRENKERDSIVVYLYVIQILYSIRRSVWSVTKNGTRESLKMGLFTSQFEG